VRYTPMAPCGMLCGWHGFAVHLPKRACRVCSERRCLTWRSSSFQWHREWPCTGLTTTRLRPNGTRRDLPTCLQMYGGLCVRESFCGAAATTIPVSWLPMPSAIRYHVLIVRSMARYWPRKWAAAGTRVSNGWIACGCVWLRVAVCGGTSDKEWSGRVAAGQHPSNHLCGGRRYTRVAERGWVHHDGWVCSRSCFAGDTPAGSTHLVPYSLSCATLDTAAADATLYVFGQASGAAITSGDITASSATSTLLALRRVAPQVHSFGLPKHCPGATVTTRPMVARARVGMWHGLTLLLHAPRTLRQRRRRRMPS